MTTALTPAPATPRVTGDGRVTFLAAVTASLLNYLAPTVLAFQVAVGLAAVAHSGFLGWSILRWRTDHFMVTDRRILRVHGIVSIDVDAVALSQITDAVCRQSLPGRILGYGQLRIESAGQRQAIDQLDYLPNPAEFYRATLLR